MKATGPDGLEAWGVALAACFINFVMAGLGRMYGILYVAFIDIFDVDRQQASVPFSARSVTRNVFGPVVGILGQKYGVRAVTVMGGIIGTISEAACFYIQDILWISFVWGGINGIGTAMIMTLPQVMIGQHFKKHLTTASGIVFSGGCVGSFIFPAMLEYMLHTYGLSGTFLLMAGIIMNVIPAAMLLMKPTWTRQIETKIEMPTIIVEEDTPTIIVEEGTPTIIVEEDTPTIIVEEDTPTIIVEEDTPTIMAEEDTPTIIVEEDTTTITIEPQSYAGAKYIDDELRKRMRDRHFTGHSNDFLNYDKDDFHKNSANRVYFIQSSVAAEVFDMRTIDTKFLRQNHNLVKQILIRYVVSKNDEIEKDNIQTYVSAYDLHEEIEYLYASVDRILGKYLLQKEKCSGESSKNNNLCAGNKCMKSKHADDNNGKKNIMMSNIKPSKKGISNNSFLMLFHNLVIKDENIILQLFPVEEHETIYKILEQFRHINHLLEHDTNLDFFSNLAAAATSECSSRKSTAEDSKPSNTFLTHIKTAFRLHTNPIFLLISLSRAVHFITLVPAVTIIVDFSMDKGLLKEDGKYVIAALAFGDLMGRLCLGWVTDREYVGLPRYMMLVMILQAPITILMSMMYSKTTLLITVTIFGLLHGSLFVRHPVLISRYLRNTEQSVAMGCFNFFSGLLGFSLPSYIGYFRDTVGSYDYIFYINGTIGALVGILWGFEPLFLKCFKTGNDRHVTL